jgi:hypothetical protein
VCVDSVDILEVGHARTTPQVAPAWSTPLEKEYDKTIAEYGNARKLAYRNATACNNHNVAL